MLEPICSVTGICLDTNMRTTKCTTHVTKKMTCITYASNHQSGAIPPSWKQIHLQKLCCWVPLHPEIKSHKQNMHVAWCCRWYGIYAAKIGGTSSAWGQRNHGRQLVCGDTDCDMKSLHSVDSTCVNGSNLLLRHESLTNSGFIAASSVHQSVQTEQKYSAIKSRNTM